MAEVDLEAALAVEDEQERARTVQDFIESRPPGFTFPDDLLPRLLALDPSYGTRGSVVGAAVRRLTPEQVASALPSITEQKNEKVWVEDLAVLTRHLPASALEAALETAEKITYEAAKWRALRNVAPFLPRDLQQRALSDAAGLEEPYHRIPAVAEILKEVPDAANDEILDLLARWPSEIEDGSSRARYGAKAASALARCGRRDDAQRLIDDSFGLLDGQNKSERPDSTPAFVLEARGDLLQVSGQHEDAIKAYQSAVSVAEETEQTHLIPPILVSLGRSQAETGSLEAAIETLARAADSVGERTEVRARRELRRLFLRLGRSDEAAEEARRIEALGYDLGTSRPDFDLSRTLTSDLPSDEDELGFAPLADALADMLNDPKTRLPITVALTAPWGGGKSSLMRQVEARLRETGTDRQQADERPRRWLPIRFDAWKFHQGEQIWASLAKEIYQQAQSQLGLLERLRFRARLEWTRGQLRTDILMALALVLLGGLSGGLLEAFGLAPSSVSEDGSIAGTPVSGAGTGLLAAVVLFFARNWKDLFNPFRHAIDRHQARQQAYDATLGITAEAAADIEALTETLTRDGSHCLVIFVDDLDRCSPAHIVAVVETINQIFNTSNDRRCAFILGIDRDVIAASLEHAYEGMVKFLGRHNPALADRFGASFLEKIVQVTVSLPEPGPEALSQLLSSVTGNEAPSRAQALRKSLEESKVQEAVELFESQALENPVEVEQRRVEVERRMSAGASDEVREAARRVRSRLLNTDSSDVARAEFELLEHLPRNPRTLKRFDNAFRLQLLVANNTPGCGLDFRYEEIEALGRCVALQFGWPELSDQLARDPERLRQLEDKANDSGAADPEGLEHWTTDGALMALLRVDQGATRVSGLPFETFVRLF